MNCFMKLRHAAVHRGPGPLGVVMRGAALDDPSRGRSTRARARHTGQHRPVARACCRVGVSDFLF